MKLLSVFVLLMISGICLLAQKQDEMLAAQYMRGGEPLKAVDLYQKLYEQSIDRYYSPYLNSLIVAKQFDKAELVVKKMIDKHPQNAEFVINLGRVYNEKGDKEKTTAVYDGLIKNIAADQKAALSLSTKFSNVHEIDYAIKVLVKARELLQNDELFALEMSNLYRYNNNKAGVLKEYLTLLKAKPESIVQVKRTVSTMFEDSKDYTMMKTELLKMIKQYPEKTVYTDLMAWQFLQQKEFALALDHLIQLDRKQSDTGKRIEEMCRTLVANEAYAQAIRGYQYLVEKGKQHQLYEKAHIELINTEYLMLMATKHQLVDLLGLEKKYIGLLAELGKTTRTAVAMEKLARLQAFELKKRMEAEKTLIELTAIPKLPAEMLNMSKLLLGDVYLLNGKPWDATLMYSQVEKTFSGLSIGQDAQFRNAKLAYFTGDFNWAKEQLSVLTAQTSQLIDNDAMNLFLMISDHTIFDTTANALKMYARADFQIFRGETELAVLTLDSINNIYPVNDLASDILMAKAKILILKMDYLPATELLKKIATSESVDLWTDDAVFMLGDIYQNELKDKSSAQLWYQKIISEYPGSLWVIEARKRLRALLEPVSPGS